MRERTVYCQIPGRRWANCLLWLLLMLTPVAAPHAAGGENWIEHSYVYKQVGSVKIEADICRPDDEAVRPGVVWIHGGALINGSRKQRNGAVVRLCQEEGYVLISLDYRLAPEVRIEAIIQDIQDAFRWIRSEGVSRFHVDGDRLVVAGGSAGGYLTMMTGICVQPPPTALVAYWGYGDVDGTWYTQPSPHYRNAVPLVPESVARNGVGKGVVTFSLGGSDAQRARGQYYLFLRQHGLWTKEVTGFDPATQTDELDRFCPVRNISAEYPPILMVHGTEDTDVPYEKSVEMARELSRHGVWHRLITVEGAGHGLKGADRDVAAEAHAEAVAFIRKRLTPEASVPR